MVKDLPTNARDLRDAGLILGSGRCLVATHSNVLAEFPWTGKPGGLQSMGSHNVRHD